MEASLDTNVIIHLYKANLQKVLFGRFYKLIVYEFIRNHEMMNHAEPEVIQTFDKDSETGRIELITNEYLKNIGMYPVFSQHVKDLRILFDGGDLGEVYAIALAKTLGCMCLVTDDIKERGPHYTLMRIPDSEVMPLSFYEVLLLDYLEEKINEKTLQQMFESISSISAMNLNLKVKLKTFEKRFWIDPYTKSENKWMMKFCLENNIDASLRIMRLRKYLK